MRGYALRRKTQRGGSDGFSQAAEFAAGPVVLGLIGWVLDSVFGFDAVFLVIFACFGLVGSFATFYFRYQQSMARENEGKPWMRRGQ